jgi:hypothetical protein
MSEKTYKEMVDKYKKENSKLKLVIKEVRTIASFYNIWDMSSMRMALSSIQSKLEGIRTSDKNN